MRQWRPGSRDGRTWIFGECRPYYTSVEAVVFRCKNDRHWCVWDGAVTLSGFRSSQEAARFALRVEGEDAP